MSDYEDKVYRWHFRNTVTYLMETSKRYAPNVDLLGDQLKKVREEVAELDTAMFVPGGDVNARKECADVIIAAVRLGTMLSPDFAQVILDKCKELNAREPLK